MKYIFILLMAISAVGFGQTKTNRSAEMQIDNYVKSVNNLTLAGAFELTKRINKAATSLNKNVSIAVLDASGVTILITRGDGVGPHNTQAAQKKAFTALSTKTATLLLLRNAANNLDTKNLNTVSDLLLLSGGVPIWYNGKIIGSVGIAGGGSPENDDLLAKSASIPELGITTTL